jgi:apolipoprotein D and lipocalin family protein
MASIGLPLLERMAVKRQPPPSATALPVDLGRYMGTWYEIARLPAPVEAACHGQPSATYRLQGGTVRVENHCPGADGRSRVSKGEARIVPGTGNALLKVSLWPALLRMLPMAWADYWIAHVDTDYRVAVVGHPSRRFCWLLSRTRRLGAEERARLVDIAAAQGFDVQRLRFVEA